MSIKKYRQKPVEIEAVKFLHTQQSYQVIEEFVEEDMHWVGNEDYRYLVIETMTGNMVAKPGDYIIKDAQGDFHPCDPDIFAANYEEVES